MQETCVEELILQTKASDGMRHNRFSRQPVHAAEIGPTRGQVWSKLAGEEISSFLKIA